jgi:hypothetical protein
MLSMLMLKLVLFRSMPIWLLWGWDETDNARYKCTNVDVLPVRTSWSWNELYLSFVIQWPWCSSSNYKRQRFGLRRSQKRKKPSEPQVDIKWRALELKARSRAYSSWAMKQRPLDSVRRSSIDTLSSMIEPSTFWLWGSRLTALI